MIKHSLTLITFLFSFGTLLAQETVVIPRFLQNPMDNTTKQNFNQSLESFFFQMTKGTIDESMLTSKRAELTQSQLQELVNYETNKDSVTLKLKDKQLINIYPISDIEYFLSISYTYTHPDSDPIQLYLINLIATKEGDKFTFSIPLEYLTRYWKTHTIDNITYYFRDKLNLERANQFSKKNTEMAKKMGLEPEKLDFFMTDNFQEISELLGFRYSFFSNGKYRDGYGVDSKTIFAIMNHEDFSHDMFHYYSSKINKRENRNWITEEGIAYLWGNAYYTDPNGEMISQDRLVTKLDNYLSKNPNTSLYTLFSEDIKIFNNIAPEISVRSTISGIIAQAVETKKGKEGITKLINAGRENKIESYLIATNKLIGINKENFNIEVKKLIEKYEETLH